MIISASRRTDIPAYYSKWFVNLLKEQYVLVPNPYNTKHINFVRLSPENVDCIVFWTKNPAPMFKYLDFISNSGYNFYFQFTLTPYGNDVEPGVPSKSKMVKIFLELSNKIGAEKVIWRYDPIIINGRFTIKYHIQQFQKLCNLLSGASNRCILSFIDSYHTGLREMSNNEIFSIAEIFAEIASKYDFNLYTCAEKTDLSRFGIKHASCIDKKLIEQITGYNINTKKDKFQRPACGCIESIDIGVYNTCRCGCTYCYAASDKNMLNRRIKAYDVKSPILTGSLHGDESITDRTGKSQKITQLSLY